MTVSSSFFYSCLREILFSSFLASNGFSYGNTGLENSLPFTLYAFNQPHVFLQSYHKTMVTSKDTSSILKYRKRVTSCFSKNPCLVLCLTKHFAMISRLKLSITASIVVGLRCSSLDLRKVERSWFCSSCRVHGTGFPDCHGCEEEDR